MVTVLITQHTSIGNSTICCKKKHKSEFDNWCICKPLHSSSQGSGCHCLFHIHMLELGPMSVNFYESTQLNVTTVPFFAEML